MDICGIYVVGLSRNQRHFGEELIFSTNTTRIVFIITMKLLQFILYLIIKHNIKIIKTFIGLHHKLLLIISGVAYLDFFIIRNIPESEVSYSAIINWIYFILLLIFLVRVFCVSLNYRNMMNENRKAEFLKKVLEEKNKNFRKIYKNDLKKFHDYKNHINLLKKYIACNENEKALSYINELINSENICSDTMWTGNDTIDYVINLKLLEGMEKGIKIEVLTNNLPPMLNEYEVCLVLFNLFDNAIEEGDLIEENKKRIKAVIESKNDLLIIRMKNYCRSNPLKEEGKLITTKTDKEKHGIGSKLVKSVADRNNGYLEYNCSKDIFEVVFMIPIN
jgi:sensor histidine kinase regulating citrate/malate metabolism